jgi:UDP-N-acetylmuramate dehydrogenase
MEILKDISLKTYSTFAVGSTCKYFINIKNREDVAEAFDFVNSKIESKEIRDFYILSGGSNTIFSDDLKDICMLKIDLKSDFEILESKSEDVTVFVKSSAGNSWDDLVSFCCDNNLYGIENLSYIPGSVGAAPVQNIGAYGVEVKDYIYNIEIYDIEKNIFQTLENKDNIFEFGYRDSIFKKYKNKYLILSVTFKLSKEKNINAKYAGLQILEIDDVKSIREKVIAIRKSKLPECKEIPNCGSFFKNPIVSKIELDKILNINKSIKYFTSGDEHKLSAAYLIESLDLKGCAMGGASISTNHALILINKNREATYKDVVDLSGLIVRKVEEKYGVILEREVNMI